MGIADDIHGAFAGVNQSGQAALDLVAKLEAAMERMDEGQLAVLLAGLGLEITDKKRGAQVIAVARQVMQAAGPLLLMAGI